MKFDGGGIVALAAILANLSVTWTTLRHQRRHAFGGKVWEKKTAAYEQFTDYLISDIKSRHDRMSAAEHPGRPGLADINTEKRLRSLNRFHLYASVTLDHLVSARFVPLGVARTLLPSRSASPPRPAHPYRQAVAPGPRP
jgi:hypothetical protein